MRPHWRALVERLTANKAHDTARRALELTRRLIVENGVAYNVYSDPQGADRPWALDPLPLVLSQDEWRVIEKGVVQRARVLDALLQDLYGPQRLLAEGLVPPELPFGHPNFLWPCHGLVPAGASWLHVYAADLARAPDGRWWLLADRTQAPSGAGYALENRDIVEQVLPEAIRDLGVRRGARFLRRDARTPAQSLRRQRQSSGRDSHSGSFQRDLFRARLYGAPARPAARGGTGPHGAQRDRVFEDARRLEARAHDSAAPR